MTEPTYDEMMEWMCTCGHTLQDHHVSFLRGGHMWADECEAYGSNETGGAEFVDGKWVDHCQHFEKAVTAHDIIVDFLVGDLQTGEVREESRVVRPVDPEEFVPQ